MITPANALKFSMWLAANHPRAFAAVLKQVQAPSRVGRTVGRFGRLGDDSFGFDLPADSLDPISVSDISVSDSVESAVTDPVLQDINVSIPDTGFDLAGAAQTADTSGGFWSSLGSGLSSVGSGLSSAIGSVAHAVLNPGTLAAAGTLAATVIQANGANAQQQVVLQAQIARTQSGAGAHPVTYTRNPNTGQTIPMVYNPASGQYQMAPSGTLTTGVAGSLTPYVPYILLGGGVILVALLMRR